MRTGADSTADSGASATLRRRRSRRRASRTKIGATRKIPVPLRADALSTTWNRTGFRGVEQVRDKYRAALGNHDWRSRYFSTAAAAARAYDAMARKVYGARGFYNFPRTGEQQVTPADPDRCRHGHPRALFTYFAPDGRPGYCRKCNKLAQKRSAARRKARPCVSDMG